jgi:hypothetical protein
MLRFGIVSLILVTGCQITVNPPVGNGDDGFVECVDPLELTEGTDFACGDEVIVVTIADAAGVEFFLDTFAIDAQDDDTNRFVLINELDLDIVGDLTLTIDGTPQTFEIGCLLPGEIFFVDSECVESFTWGDPRDGLCLFEPLLEEG